MTTTETKTRTSEAKITRRKMLQVLPLTSAAIASSAMAVAAVPDTPSGGEPSEALLEAIQAHRRARELFCDAVSAADDMHPEYKGAEAEAEAEAIANILCDAELEARHLLLAFPIASLTDAQAKTTYLTAENFDLDDVDIAILLRSIAAPGVARPALSPPNTLPHESLDPVFAAIVTLKAADEKSIAAYEALDNAETAARVEHGNRPHELIAWRNYSAIGGSEIDDRRERFLRQRVADPAQIEIEYQDAKRRYEKRVREGKTWDRLAGITSLREQNDQARRDFWTAAEALANTVPTTLPGAHLLLDLVVRELEWGDDEWMHRSLSNARTAILTLAKTAI